MLLLNGYWSHWNLSCHFRIPYEIRFTSRISLIQLESVKHENFPESDTLCCNRCGCEYGNFSFEKKIQSSLILIAGRVGACFPALGATVGVRRTRSVNPVILPSKVMCTSG